VAPERYAEPADGGFKLKNDKNQDASDGMDL